MVRARGVAEAIAVAHEHGAEVTANCFGTAVLPGLIEAEIDYIGHGNWLDAELVESMVAHGTGLVPTVTQVDKFPEYAEAGAEKSPTTRRRWATSTPGAVRRSRPSTRPGSAHAAGRRAAREDDKIAGEVRAMAELWTVNEGAPSEPRPGGSASGWAGTRRSTRARPLTSPRTPPTRWPTCPAGLAALRMLAAGSTA